MKKIFKTAIVAAMSFLALGMMSCQKDDDDHEILEQTGFGANAQWTIDYTNESGTYNRGFNVLSQKHTSGTCTVTIGDFPECGVAGFVFGKTNNLDGTANFGLVGIKRHTSTALKYYVSWYKNVDLTKMDGFDNFAGTDGKVANGANNSCIEIDKTSGWKTLNDYITAGAPASIVIKVEATGTDSNSNNKIEASESDGGYTVTLQNVGAVIQGNYNITKSDTGLEKADQCALGAYANVYPLKSMYATITMSDLVQELAVEE
ncbi:hypothetical protein [Treponema sp.]|uniref:hypothetical protein n=1 Tax=Treponema sp. TaxID=166 RepID=UPI002A82866A|nr:hypothetical protein [Treponema sp.]MCI6442389.1 hypothetical protein [Spirochaetia bacterium]MDY4132055.1 hypothetical protein [Treponema sp.]